MFCFYVIYKHFNLDIHVTVLSCIWLVVTAASSISWKCSFTWWRVMESVKRIFETVKSPIDADKYWNTIYSYFHSNARQKYLYLGLRNSLKVAKNIMPRNIVDYFGAFNIIKTRDVIWNDVFIFYHIQIRAPDNFQVQRVITPYFWKWWVFAYFLCTVVLSTSEKIAYMYTFKIMFDKSVIQ
jgi:hypothetical protein